VALQPDATDFRHGHGNKDFFTPPRFYEPFSASRHRTAASLLLDRHDIVSQQSRFTSR